MHIKGHGGLEQCVANVQKKLPEYQFVCKTDVKSFYESIDQNLLVEELCGEVEDKVLRRYLYQIIHRTVEYGSNYQEIMQLVARMQRRRNAGIILPDCAALNPGYN